MILVMILVLMHKWINILSHWIHTSIIRILTIVVIIIAVIAVIAVVAIVASRHLIHRSCEANV